VATSCTSVVFVEGLVWLPSKWPGIFGGYFEKVLFIFVVLMTSWTSTVGPEAPAVQILSNWCKSLTRFCQPFLLTMHGVLPRVSNCCGIDKPLLNET
jgi:hypothetical protein